MTRIAFASQADMETTLRRCADGGAAEKYVRMGEIDMLRLNSAKWCRSAHLDQQTSTTS